MSIQHNIFRHISSTLHRLAFVAALAFTVTPSVASAQQQSLIVGNDRGGSVSRRAKEIAMIKTAGRRVEIRGAICYSSCTLYLGASNVCVSPNTSFGFHGPSLSGQQLPTAQFEKWSRFMAGFYNAPLRRWFMAQGRYAQTSLYRMSGRELIAIGYQTC